MNQPLGNGLTKKKHPADPKDQKHRASNVAPATRRAWRSCMLCGTLYNKSVNTLMKSGSAMAVGVCTSCHEFKI